MSFFHRIQKRDFSQARRDKLANTGAAMPDGSFPIVNGGDLENAIRLAGKAKDPEAAKAHIKTRAKTLGLESKLPDGWKSSKKEDTTMTTKQDLTGLNGGLASLFRTTSPVVGTEASKQVDIASVGKLVSIGFPSESLAGVQKAEKEAFERIMKGTYTDPNAAPDNGGAAAPQADPTGGTTKPAPKVTWAKRSQMAMSAKSKNTGRPIDAILPFMQGKFGMNLFQSTGVNSDDIPTILEAFKQGGFTMAAPTDDGDNDGPDCYSFMSKDGTHVYMEVDADQGSIAWVIETPDKEITVDGPPPVGDTRQVQSRFAKQQKRAKIAQNAQAQAQVQGPAQGAPAAPGVQQAVAGPGGQVQKAKKWDRLRPIF